MQKKKNKETKPVITDAQQAIHDIESRFGKDAIFQMGGDIIPVDSISTGSIPLNEAIGVGGYPTGRIIEIYGPESSGKTTLALHALAEAQKKGGNVAFIDAEHALDLKYAKNIGINIDKLWVSQPNNGEEALEICDTLVRSNDFSIIVVDSVAALTPKAEIEGEMGQSHMGLQARLMSQGLRKLSGIVAKTNTIIIFINQIRHKIGIMFGSPETTTGGNALKFYASVRLDIRRRDKILNKQGEIIGNLIDIKVVKNKVAPPFKEVKTSIMFGIGIHRPGELLLHHIDEGTIEKSGSWYKHGDYKCQGELAIFEYIANNLDIFEI